MPFVAVSKNGFTIPTEAEEAADLYCPSCGSELGTRKAHIRNGYIVSKHFFHQNDTCSYESDKHMQMKAIASSVCQQIWSTATVSVDKTYIGDRKPDVLVEFDRIADPFGQGICIEAQYRNRSKDKKAVSENYKDKQYSTVWLTESDFADMTVKIPVNSFRMPTSFTKSRYMIGPQYRIKSLLENNKMTIAELSDELDMDIEWVQFLCWNFKAFGDWSLGSINIDNGVASLPD